MSIRKRPTALDCCSSWAVLGSSWQPGCRGRTWLLPRQPRALRRRFHPALQYRQFSSPRMGTGFDASPPHGGNASADSATDKLVSVEEETRRLMSVPTIDIKLELQMRGVEHRDAFEKLDLAKRLAEVRLLSLSAGGGGGGDVEGCGAPQAAERGQEGDAAEAEAAGDGSSSSTRWRRSWSKSSEATPPAARGEPHGERAEEGEGEDGYHARCAARAMRMGKPAVMRELNAMGIAHSRLSDMTVLARQYASAKSEARAEAEAEAGLFVADEGLEQRLEAARFATLGKTELTVRLRALEIDFSRQASELELGMLLAKAGGEGAAATAAAAANQAKGAASSSTDKDENNYDRTTGGRKRGWGWERWTGGRRQHGGAASVLPWSDRQDVDEEDEEEADEEEEKIEAPIDQGPRWSGKSSTRRFESGADTEPERSVRDNAARNVVPDEEASGENFGRREFPAGVTPAGGGMKVPLQARAGRMSSRELMSALDSLGVAYPIPSPRSELEEAFVSAVLAGQGDTTASSKGGRVGNNIARLNPFSWTTGGDEAGDGEYRPASFETYHAALQWARQLTLDDVVEELHYRGVEFKPNGDFSYLTRLLADEVLMDEELMEEEENRKDYAEALEAAMSLSVEDVCSELRAGGIEFDVALSKSKLTRLLAEAKSQTGAPIAGRLPATSGLPRRPDSQEQDRAAAAAAGTADRERVGQRSRGEPSRGVAARGSFRFGDDGEEPLSDSDEALLEIESIARSIGGAAWGAVQETASIFAGVASTLLPEAFPLPEEDEEDSAEEGEEGSPRRRRPSRISQARRARMARDRASGLRRGASAFVQSSANRAGLAVVRSAANGVLRGAEAAADWAGGGAVAREHVLLFIAAFCLAFKRGIGSSVALLVLIRAARISLQRLLEGGRTAATGRTRGDAVAGARPPHPAAAVAGASASGRREATRAVPTRGGRRAASSGKVRSRPTRSRPSEAEKRERGSRRTVPAAGAGRARAKRGMQGRRRRPVVDDFNDSDSDGGCTVM